MEMRDWSPRPEEPISSKLLSDLLVTAFEGGSSYWVEYANYVNPSGMSMDDLRRIAWQALPPTERQFWKTPEGVPLYAILPYLKNVRWKIKFLPSEGTVVYLTPNKMKKGAAKLAKEYPEIFQRIKEEQYDAGDADAWLQMALFGEIVYG